MRRLLRQSTAVTVKSFAVLDLTDLSAETAQTIQKADVRLSKNGGNMAAASSDQGSSDAGAPHDELGKYDLSLDATDTATLGDLDLVIAKSATLPVEMGFTVLPANVFDSLLSGSDLLDVNTAQLGGTSQTGNDVGADVNDILVDTAEIGAAGAGLTALATAANLATVDTVVDGIAASLAAAADTDDFGVMISTTIASVTSQTVFVLTDGSPDDDAYNNRVAVVQDQTTGEQKSTLEVSDYAGSTKTLTLAAGAVFTVAAGDNIVITSVPVAATGSAPTAAQNATAVLEKLVADHSAVSGSLAERLSRIPNVAAGGNGGLPTVDANNRIAGIQGTKNTLDDLNDITVAAILSGFGTSGSLDTQLSTIAGYLDTEIDGIITSLGTIAGYLDTEVAAIKAKTDALPSDPADQSSVEAAITAAQGVITALLGSPSTDVSADIASVLSAVQGLNNLSAAQVNAQVLDVMNVDTYGDPSALGAALGSSLSVIAKVNWVFAYLLRERAFNKTTGVNQIKNAAGTSIAESTAADDGTITSQGAFGAPA